MPPDAVHQDRQSKSRQRGEDGRSDKRLQRRHPDPRFGRLHTGPQPHDSGNASDGYHYKEALHWRKQHGKRGVPRMKNLCTRPVIEKQVKDLKAHRCALDTDFKFIRES